MLNAISISAYGNSLHHLYMLQINANAFTDLHHGYRSRISVYGNVHLHIKLWFMPKGMKCNVCAHKENVLEQGPGCITLLTPPMEIIINLL